MLYIFALSITPGPNNIMLATSGMNFGFKSTIPHLLGITFGALILVVISSLGLGAVFVEIPSAKFSLFFIGSVYLIYLSIKIYNSGEPVDGMSRESPISFMNAMIFQFVNPKTWLMAANLIILFSIEGKYFFSTVLYICVLLILVNLPSICVWVLLGSGFKRLLKNNRKRRVYNTIMSLLLFCCIPMLYWD